MERTIDETGAMEGVSIGKGAEISRRKGGLGAAHYSLMTVLRQFGVNASRRNMRAEVFIH
jgi:hypothetical protein